MSRAEAITRAYGGDWHGSYGTIPTPGHSAKDRGTTVRDADDGDVVFASFNGGDWRELKNDCRRRGLLDDKPVNGAPQWRVRGSYEFKDEAGAVLYRTRRHEREGEPKRYTVERPDAQGGWINGLGDTRRVLYRLPELLAANPAKPVYLVEGERKADELAGWGLTATAIAFGCKGWRKGYADALAGRVVAILPDNDEAGRDFAERARADINGAGGTAIIVELPGLPPKGDIMDWAGTAEELQALTDAAVSSLAKLLPLIDIDHWRGDPPPRRSFWGDLLPLLQTTMLTGLGGVGKSLFAQVLLTHIALGIPFLGLSVEQMIVLYATCEDDADELWRRQAAICAALGVPTEAIAGKLFLCSLTGETDTALATFDVSGRIRPTERWRELERTCDAMNVGIYAFDNATDAMAGDLNDIHQVAEFVNLLTGLAIRRQGAAIIIHHPNKNGEDWLGSVAWHNKVRSRLIIEAADEDSDSDARVIRNPKANYGPSGGRIAFRWHRGTFLRDEDLPEDYAAALAETVKASAENSAFLECLRARAAQGEGRLVGPSPGPNYAPTQFEGMTQAKGFKKQALKRAMDRLFLTGVIEAHTYRNKAKGRDVTVIREVPDCSPNARPNASRTLFPNAPEPDPEHPRAHSLYPTDNMGAAIEAAAPLPSVDPRADELCSHCDGVGCDRCLVSSQAYGGKAK